MIFDDIDGRTVADGLYIRGQGIDDQLDCVLNLPTGIEESGRKRDDKVRYEMRIVYETWIVKW